MSVRVTANADSKEAQRLPITVSVTMSLGNWTALMNQVRTVSDKWPSYEFFAAVQRALEKIGSSVTEDVEGAF